MSQNEFNRPDAKAIKEALVKYQCTATAVVIRLAWQAGLLRNEIANLRWNQVDLSAGKIYLPHRIVPIEESLHTFLHQLYTTAPSRNATVLLSDRGKHPIKPQSISRLVRQAMNYLGQPDIRLIDLRHDYIINQLKSRDWQEVSRIAGVGARAMKLHFGNYLPHNLSLRANPESGKINSKLLNALLEKEGTSPVGLAIALTWKMGLSLTDIVSLTWEQVENLTCPVEVTALLAQVKRTGDNHVLLSPKARKPYDKPQLSRLIRHSLVKAGLDDVSLIDIYQDFLETQIMEYIATNKTISRSEAAKLLSVSAGTAHHLLEKMHQQKKIMQVGNRYYSSDTVVSPSQQHTVIITYLKNHDYVQRRDVADLLGLMVRQCEPILQGMVDNGTLIKQHRKYYLATR